MVDEMFSHEEDTGRVGWAVDGFNPPSIAWDHSCSSESKSCFVTDNDIVRIESIPLPESKYKVAFVLESGEIQSQLMPNGTANSYLMEDDTMFDFILTHDPELLKKEKALPYPTIQYHVTDSSPVYKDKLVSMISSCKNYAVGHRLRHEVIKTMNGKFDLYGRGFNEIERKEEGLRPYLFSIAIENTSSDWYFTEKILDCFVTRTVPIYWGSPKINEFFNPEGLITFNDINELSRILQDLSVEKYKSMLDAVEENYNLAKTKYSSCEEWIYNQYPFLFDGDIR